MKKYIYILFAALFLGLTACDYNDHNFDGLDDLSKPSNVVQYEYQVTASDFTTMVNALRASKTQADSIIANQLNTDKMFSDLAPAEKCIPYLLTSKYYTVDKNSSANITYEFKNGRTPLLSQLATPNYTLTNADYQLTWGKEFVAAFTPGKLPNTEIPRILAANYKDAKEGDYKNVDYNYSAVEPSYDVVEVSYLNENFENQSSGTNVAVSSTGWINKDTKNSLFWQCRIYSGNQYAQVSANGTGVENDVWLITHPIDLKDAAEPKFSFNITAGYVNANILTVLVSTNFNGTESGITSATWTDITSNFAIPTGPASGYGTLGPAGTMDLSAYAGKTVYIAFHYAGNGIGNVATTTYQIDNIKVSEMKTAMAVESTERKFATFKYSGGKWVAAESNITILQPADYTMMGRNYLSNSATSEDYAPDYIPQLLSMKYPFAQKGALMSVIFRTSNTANYADEYTLTEGKWVLNNFVEKKTSQFIFSGLKDGWVFDPTLYVTMVKGKNATDDYMMMVNYVIKNYEGQNPKLINSYRDSEYYYGFSGNYGNISLRQADRLNDVTYATLTTDEERKAYFRERTIEGLEIYLSLKFPEQQPQVSGIDVHAIITCAIYNGNYTDYNSVFEFECVSKGVWKYLETITDPGMW